MKNKVLMLSDNPLQTSGVGCQARYLIDGLLKKNRWSFRCLGGAIKHVDYSTQHINDDFIVKPIDGFGNPDMLRMVLMQEKPDVLLLFTDPRFFTWVWEMEDEVHQICPIAYWHVWDNTPYPEFNSVLYESTDLINCHSYLTYEMVHERFPDRTNFVPHALPQDIFKPLPHDVAMSHKERLLGKERLDHFVCIWVNRNARRKMPGNVMAAWAGFVNEMEQRLGHSKFTLLMHTDPYDSEGQNLPALAEMLNISKNVVYSPARVPFEEMAAMYSFSDCCITLPIHEGFGLSTLEAMQCGKPIIAHKTGGLTRQVVDHRDGSENGIALDPDIRDLVGGQSVPYIWEDHVSIDKAKDALVKMYEMGSAERERLGDKARDYVLSEFALQDTIDAWDRTLFDVVDKWKRDRQSVYNPWEVVEL